MASFGFINIYLINFKKGKFYCDVYQIVKQEVSGSIHDIYTFKFFGTTHPYEDN